LSRDPAFSVLRSLSNYFFLLQFIFNKDFIRGNASISFLR